MPKYAWNLYETQMKSHGLKRGYYIEFTEVRLSNLLKFLIKKLNTLDKRLIKHHSRYWLAEKKRVAVVKSTKAIELDQDYKHSFDANDYIGNTLLKFREKRKTEIENLFIKILYIQKAFAKH